MVEDLKTFASLQEQPDGLTELFPEEAVESLTSPEQKVGTFSSF